MVGTRDKRSTFMLFFYSYQSANLSRGSAVRNNFYYQVLELRHYPKIKIIFSFLSDTEYLIQRYLYFSWTTAAATLLSFNDNIQLSSYCKNTCMSKVTFYFIDTDYLLQICIEMFTYTSHERKSILCKVTDYLLQKGKSPKQVGKVVFLIIL